MVSRFLKGLVLGMTLLVSSSWSAAAQEARRISAPPQYQEWFNEVSQCVGADRSFYALSFWTIEGEGWYDEEGDFILGSYYWMTHRIYLARTLMTYEPLVKHEMMHYLIDPYGQHPSPPYNDCEYQVRDSWSHTP